MSTVHIIFACVVIAMSLPTRDMYSADSVGTPNQALRQKGDDGAQKYVQDRLYQLRLRIRSGDNSTALWQEFGEICNNASASKTNTTDCWIHYAYAHCLYLTSSSSSLEKARQDEVSALAHTLAEMAWTNGLPCAAELLALIANKSGNDLESVKWRKTAASQGCVPALRTITMGSNYGSYPSKYFQNAEDEYYHSFLYMLLEAWTEGTVNIRNPIIQDHMVTLEVAKERNTKSILKIRELEESAIKKFNEITHRYKRNEVIGWVDPYVSKKDKRP